MNLDERLKQLSEFQTRQARELEQFMSGWETQLASDIGLVLPDRKDKPVFLARDQIQSALKAIPASPVSTISDDQKVEQGIYRGPLGIRARVIFQNVSTSMIAVDLLGVDYKVNNYQYISPSLFKRIFTREEESEVSELETTSALRLTHDWRQSLDWKAIVAAAGQVSTHFDRLNKAVTREDQEQMQSECIELIFMIYVLAGRIGLPIENDFLELHRNIFGNVDRSIEDAETTKKMYAERGVAAEFVEIRLYHPMEMTKPPVCYYVTVSSKEQTQDGKKIAAGSFLPSYGRVMELSTEIQRDI